MNEKKMQELMNDEEFVKKLVTLDSGEKILEEFRAKGLEITAEELEKFEADGKKILEDGDLESISGGAFMDMLSEAKDKVVSGATEVWNATEPQRNDFVEGAKECVDVMTTRHGEHGIFYNVGGAAPIVIGTLVAVGITKAGFKMVGALHRKIKGSTVREIK